MVSFLSLGQGSDEVAYFKQIIDEAMSKADMMPYTERRAMEMNMSKEEDFSMEGK